VVFVLGLHPRRDLRRGACQTHRGQTQQGITPETSGARSASALGEWLCNDTPEKT
jgi:hypothetical protein